MSAPWACLLYPLIPVPVADPDQNPVGAQKQLVTNQPAADTVVVVVIVGLRLSSSRSLQGPCCGSRWVLGLPWGVPLWDLDGRGSGESERERRGEGDGRGCGDGLLGGVVAVVDGEWWWLVNYLGFGRARSDGGS